VLRFRRKDQEYKHPGNLQIGGREIPVGLVITTAALFLLAIANLISKEVATIWGVLFTLLLFAVFTISERVNAHQQKEDTASFEQFNLKVAPEVDVNAIHARPGSVLVAVRDNRHLAHLQNVLRRTNLRRQDIVVMTVRPITAGEGEYGLQDSQLFAHHEQALFTRVVSMAEKEGKSVELLVVPALDPLEAIVQTAARLKVSRLVTGVSVNMEPEELARRVGLAWERLPEPKHAFSLEIISPNRPSSYVNLGPHPPRLWPEDLGRLHDLWLDLSDRLGYKLHHRDVVGVALRRLERDLHNERREETVEEFRHEMLLDPKNMPASSPSPNGASPGAPADARSKSAV